MIEAITDFDFAVLDFIREHLTCSFMDAFMSFITVFGNGGAVWIVMALALTVTKKHRRAGIMMIAALLVCLLTGNLLLKNLIARPRPFIQDPGVQLIISPPSGYSFPSGHTFSSIISATVLSKYSRRAAPWVIIFAVLIAFSRLYLYVHFPTDVLCGAVLGVALGLAVYHITEKFLPNKEKLSETTE